MNNGSGPDLYNVSTYTDNELFDILELDNPSDRVLEAKILSMVNKYDSMEGKEARLLAHFFIDIYARFFDTSGNDSGTEDSDDRSDDDYEVEGFVGVGNATTYTTSGYVKDGRMTIDYADPIAVNSNIQMNKQGDAYSGGYGGKGYNLGGYNSEYSAILTKGNIYNEGDDYKGNTTDYSNFEGNTQLRNEGGAVISSQSPKITQTFGVNQVVNQGKRKSKDDATGNQLTNTQLTKQIDYSKDVLNPLLKQTIKRVISIDSQYRENKQSSSTEFTFNLSEPLRDVVSLKLYSIQIPYTWYTINGSFGGNFFYIKGNAPGIDNGDHDHKIEVPSGNYTGPSLVNDIQTSINQLKTTVLDVSFGTTSITYNGSTVLSTIAIDIKEIFGESNYYLEFPTPPTFNPRRNTNLADFLGYNNQRYDVCSVFSGYISNTTLAQSNITIPANTIIELKTYTVGNTITENYSIPGTPAIYGNIIIPVAEVVNTTIGAVVSDIHNKLMNRPEVDTAHSFVRLVESGLGDNTQRIQWNIKWKRTYIQSVEHLKTVVLVPSSWVSTFQFPALVNESSNIVSENPLLQSKYIIDPNANQIQLKCIHPGYDNGPFDYTIAVPSSTGRGYKLEEYIEAINSQIQTQNTNNNSLGNTRIYSVDDTSYVNLDVRINTVFTKKDYTVRFQGTNIPRLFGKTAGDIIQLYDDTSFNTSSLPSSTNTIIVDSTDKIYIRSTIDTTIEYTIQFTPFTSNDATEIITKMLGNIQGYAISGNTNVYNKHPFIASTMTTSDSTDLSKFKLDLQVNQKLVTSDYKMNLLSTQTPNTWREYLRFDSSYALDITPPYSIKTIQNNGPVYDNQIVLNETNNYFTLKSFSDVNGLTYAGAGLYDVSINITPTLVNPNGKYTSDEIIDAINARLSENRLTAGSSIRTVDANYMGKTVFRVDINKAFRTSDYRLVFYDPYSFVSCYSGASRSGSKSIQNATWDTTVGWILGFRGSIIYYLDNDEYLDASVSQTNPRIYYNADKTICTLIGDTTVSTSLYNYFLIALDDYTQNHLNDGLVTITMQETAIDVGPYKYICNPYSPNTNALIAVPIRNGINTDNGKITGITQKELYTFNEKLLSKQVKEKSYSKGPFVKDIFGIIPIKTAGLTTGSTYVEFGGTLQNQERMYFGPVNIHRMTIRLLNDRGDMVDLNNANWSFSLVCEQLYRS